MPAEPTRLLLIDDDPDLRRIFVFSMEKQGFAIDVAKDGDVGLEKVSAFRPDVVLLDLMMPKANGFEFLQRLQQDGIKIPVIVVTGFGNKANEQAIAQEANVMAYLTKPLNYPDLAKKIRERLAAA